MSWLNILVKCGQLALYDLELFREPLKQYINKHFPEHNENQLLLFDLTHDDFINVLLDKVLSIPFSFSPGKYPDERPNGNFNGEQWFVEIGGIDEKKYRRGDRYTDYVDSVVFHELTHVVNYIKKLFDSVDYDTIMLGHKYYGNPEEQRAYTAQLQFLKEFLGIKPYIARHLMNFYSSDPDKKTREEWMRYYNEPHN